MNYCSACGHAVENRIPDGDHQLRDVCPSCKTVHYVNPKVIVGCIPEWEDGRVLMCRRAIEPRLGKWTFPAGFMELNETTGAGAARETLEESGATVETGGLLAVITVSYVSQIYMIHRAKMLSATHHATSESSETQLMREDEIPWDEIAFPTIWHSLRFFFDDRAKGIAGFHSMDITQRSSLPPLRPIAETSNQR